MWITPVEKVVDNVENYELSTGIPSVCILFTTGYSPAYFSVYSLFHSYVKCVTSPFYVTRYGLKKQIKVGYGGNCTVKNSPLPLSEAKYLCKTDKKLLGIIFSCLEILCIWNFTNNRRNPHAGKSGNLRSKHIQAAYFIPGRNGPAAAPGSPGR